MLKSGSLFDTEQLFLPYMTLCLKFIPYMTFRPILQLTVLNNTWKDILAPGAKSGHMNDQHEKIVCQQSLILEVLSKN
jgi:hypothetical protein